MYYSNQFRTIHSGTITNISVANPTVVTSANHGLTTGRSIVISGSNSTPAINNAYQVTVIDANTFTVPVNVTVAGNAGTWLALPANWTHAAGTRWIPALVAQLNSNALQCSSGSGVQSIYLANNAVGTRENVDMILMVDRQSGGIYNLQVDLNIPGATRGTGFSVRLHRTTNADDSVEVDVTKLGVGTDTPTTGLDDPFAWIWRITLTWSDADATVTVYALQADYTWAQVHQRVMAAAGASYESGVIGLHCVSGTTPVGRAFVNFIRVAAGTDPYVMLTRPAMDDTPFQRSTAAPHRLLVRGVCGNMGSGKVEGRFVTVGDPDPAWQVIDSAPGPTFAGEITTSELGSGTVQVRPSNNITAVDQIEGCTVCEIIIVAGQSNAQGRCTDKQVFTPANGITGALIWQAIIDQTAATGDTGNQFWVERDDENDGTTSRFVYQAGNTEGTPWPLFCSELAEHASLQCAIIGHGEGTTGLASGTPTWQRGQTHYNRLLHNLRRSGITRARCLIWVQGEYDCQQSGTETDYLTQLVALRSNLISDSGVQFEKFFTYTIGFIQSGSITTDDLAQDQIDPIRAAAYRAEAEYPAHFRMGGNVYIIDLADDAGDNIHFQTNADAGAFASLMADAFLDEFYGTQTGGPKLEYARWRTPYSVFACRFSRRIALGGDGSFAGTKVTVAGSEAAHTAAISSDGYELLITLNTPATASQTVRVFYPTGNACANGGARTAKFLADAKSTGRPAYPFVATVTTSDRDVLDRRSRRDRFRGGPSRLRRG